MQFELWSSRLGAFLRRGIYIRFFTACCSLWGKSIIHWPCNHFGNSLNHLRNLIINYLLAAFKLKRAAEKIFHVFREMQNNLCSVELYIWARNCYSYVRQLLLSHYVIAPWSLYSSLSRFSGKQSFCLLPWWKTGFSKANRWCLRARSQTGFVFQDSIDYMQRGKH